MILNIKPSQMAEDFFYLSHGEPLGFNDFPFFRAIYNSKSRVNVMKCSRQVGKSVTLVVRPYTGILEAEMGLKWMELNKIPREEMSSYGLRPRSVLTVTPTLPQARKFSEQKLSLILNSTPIIDLIKDRKCSDLVMSKTYSKGSSYSLAACYRSSDTIRGQTNDDINIDEIQDVDPRFIPVIFETQNRSKRPTRFLSGTTKTTTNTIEYYWGESTQNEWVVRCTGCNKIQVLMEGNIGKNGPICSKCGKYLDTIANGQWAAMNNNGSFDGWRINSLMAEFYLWTADRGSEMWPYTLMYKYETYPKAKFDNEVLAIPCDSGKKPISREEIMACCSEEARRAIGVDTGMVPASKNIHQRAMVCAGIDWGTSLDGNAKTVLTISSNINHKFVVLYAKKYGQKESDPIVQIQDIIKICKAYNVAFIGVDEGFGHMKNELLAKEFGHSMGRGNSSMVMKFSNSATVKERLKWNDKGLFYSLNRTEVLSDLFLAIKSKVISFPSWNIFSEFADDIMAVDVEYNESIGNMCYTHKPTEPDDFVFSLVYSLEPILLRLGRSTLCNP